MNSFLRLEFDFRYHIKNTFCSLSWFVQKERYGHYIICDTDSTETELHVNCKYDFSSLQLCHPYFFTTDFDKMGYSYLKFMMFFF